MRIKKLAFYLLAALLGGCVPSLHPLYTYQDITHDDKLIGTWTGNDQTLKFTKLETRKFYDLTSTLENKQGKFSAHLVKLGQMLFLDLYPKGPKLENATGYYKSHLLKAHTFIKIEQIEPTLKLQGIDAGKLKIKLQSDPNLIKHEIVRDSVVLTASTKELQEFMKKYINDPSLIGDPLEYKRVEAKEPEEPGESSQTESSE